MASFLRKRYYMVGIITHDDATLQIFPITPYLQIFPLKVEFFVNIIVNVVTIPIIFSMCCKSQILDL